MACGDNLTNSSFVLDPTGEFWFCPHCHTIPEHLRSDGWFSRDPPQVELVQQHIATCNGVMAESHRGLAQQAASGSGSFLTRSSFFDPPQIPHEIGRFTEGQVGGQLSRSPRDTHYHVHRHSIGDLETGNLPHHHRQCDHRDQQQMLSSPTLRQSGSSLRHHGQEQHPGFPSSGSSPYQMQQQQILMHLQHQSYLIDMQRESMRERQQLNQDASIGFSVPSEKGNILPEAGRHGEKPQSFTHHAQRTATDISQDHEAKVGGHTIEIGSSSGNTIAAGRAVADLLAAQSSIGSLEETPDDVVLPEDRLLLTDYFYYLNQQLKLCHFSEGDRKTRGGKRQKIPIGYGGLECRHCANPTGNKPPKSRKFFWSDVDRLSNSFAEISGHIFKCRYCPEGVKNALRQLKARHPEQISKLPRGSQKVFFRRMWRRLHSSEDEKADRKPSAAYETVAEGSPQSLPYEKKIEGGFASLGGSSSMQKGGELSKTNEDLGCSVLTVGTHPNRHVLLAIAEDKQWLSDLDCFVRRSLEVFTATESDVTANQKEQRYPISLGQVGIRCIHCSLSSPKRINGSAVAYPYSLSSIHETVREIERLHLDNCPNVPSEDKGKVRSLQSSASLSSVLRRYYVLAAKVLGLYDASGGVRVEGGSIPRRGGTPFDPTPLSRGEDDAGGPASSTNVKGIYRCADNTLEQQPPTPTQTGVSLNQRKRRREPRFEDADITENVAQKGSFEQKYSP